LLVTVRDVGDGGDRVTDLEPLRVVDEAGDDLAAAVDDRDGALSAVILCGKFGPRQTPEVEA